MSSASASSRSWKKQHGHLDSVVQHGRSRSRGPSRVPPRPPPVTLDEAFDAAVRVAYLHYLLQPKKKRKEYVSAPPKPVQRIHTSSIGDLMKDFIPTNAGGSTSSHKLPHSFRPSLEKRMQGVVTGTERLPGYNEPNVRRSFAEAYTAFTEANFRKSVDKERKLEPLILIFYSSATKAQAKGKAPDDTAWKLLVDRHLALFVRLITHVLREHWGDQRPELMSRLSTLENKLLTNDQNLYLDAGQEGDHKTIEVDIPLTYDVKDMPMVLVVARIFARNLEDVQAMVGTNRHVWTEEAALLDLKQYQHRLNSNMPGALRRQDFDVDDAFDEWKKAEGPFLSEMMLDILTARPGLAKTTSSFDNMPLPPRPQSSAYGEDQAYADLSRVISAPGGGPRGSAAGAPGLGLDGQSLGLGSSSNNNNNPALDDAATAASGIRSVDEPSYVFIPPEPLACYRLILTHTMSYDQFNWDKSVPYTLLSRQSQDFMDQLAVHWRIPQFSRHVVILDVAAQKLLDQTFTVEELDTAFEYVKAPPPAEVNRKPPRIQHYADPLPEIDTRHWTMQDFATYQRLLSRLNDALLRDLYDVMQQCYDPKPPPIGVIMFVLMSHIYAAGPASVQREEDARGFADHLAEGLKHQAAAVYRGYLDAEIPRSQEDWDFGHVVRLGQSVVRLCERIRKRYRKTPEIMGVNPYTVLVETMFPNFEEDAHDIIKRIIQVAKDRGREVNMQDGFDLYKELVEIRKIHVECLPGQPFAFHIESLLEEFVWRWIKGAEERMTDFVDQAIRQDQFRVRTQQGGGRGGGGPEDQITPSDADRHSVSVVDMFQLFNQTVDQVFQLGWDDDVHHARFMTALSKAFAAGIGRYCETAEARFVAEMDRQTAQELAATRQTTQERFMQYAKDALSNKEKVEPFQFYPESFVKLNNIEYAMQELDKLEKLVNVDGCAEVLLQRANGPTQKPLKPQGAARNAKYVFTVKIIEAEDLKACDANGTSDPYVVLGDEYGKRLMKTRIIMRNLNPRWDESVDMTVSGALNIVATIWDYDTFGQHDFVGRTTLKLDPVHFSDYLPREFWLDLDTQGRLLLRVSMEGERDDIQFHFGKAFRHLKRTERDMVRKITDKLTTHINASLSPEALKSMLSRGIAASMSALWSKRTSKMPSLSDADVENAMQSLFTYFDENFAIMKQTLTDATMLAVMTRLWKEVLMAIEALVVPPLSEKPSAQKPLTQAELDVVFKWLQLLFEFFNAKDEEGVVLGVPADVLKSPKWSELASLAFFYLDSTDNLIRTSERMTAATAQRQQQAAAAVASSPAAQHQQNHLAAPPAPFGGMSGMGGGGPGFASMGTIRRGKSIMMSRNLKTIRRAKEEKRKEAQADPSDDMILRILRMRPEAAGYLKERYRQKERMAAAQAAAMIVRHSVHQGWNSGPAAAGGGALGAAGMAPFGRRSLPRR